MKLTYRGNTYELNRNQAHPGNAGRPTRPAHTARAPYTVMYRGVKMVVDPAAVGLQDERPDTYELTYRGVTYQVSWGEQGRVMAVSQPARQAITEKVVVPAALPLSAIARVHKANLLDNLQRRLQAAQTRHDQALVSQLEAELQQITAAYSN